MTEYRSLLAAMESLTFAQDASSLPTSSIPTQSPNSILGEWELDRIGTGNSLGSNPGSTVEQLHKFAQSHVSRKSPPSGSRNAGNVSEGVWRNENWKTGVGDHSDGLRPGGAGPISPTLPTLPTLPREPLHRQTQSPTQQTASRPRSCALTPALPQPSPQDQALRKRTSEHYLGQNPETAAHEPPHKKASPDRTSPLSASVSGEAVSNRVTITRGNFSRIRRASVERWALSRSRPYVVAPDGTIIKPTQPKSATLQQQQQQQQPLPCPGPQTPPQNKSATVSRTQSPQFLHRTTPSRSPSTRTAVAANSSTAAPPNSRIRSNDDVARRMIYAGIGIARAPKRTKEELRKRQEGQEKRRLQREERERLGEDEMMKWSGRQVVVETEIKTARQAIVKKDLIRPIPWE